MPVHPSLLEAHLMFILTRMSERVSEEGESDVASLSE